jgi:hypothetical protein
MRQYHRYTEEELQFLKNNAEGRTREELTELFNRHFSLRLDINEVRKKTNKPPIRAPSRKYTSEQLQFIRDNIVGRTCAEMTDLFNQHFGLQISRDKMKSILRYYNMKAGRITQQYHHYTTEEIQFIRENFAGHSYAEIVEMFYRHYGVKLCVRQIVKVTSKDERQKLKYYRALKTGTEIKNNGYTYVKIADPDVWKPKHRLIWEKANGPVPKGHVIMFADGNKSNFDLSNLLLVSKKALMTMNTHALIFPNPELTKIGKTIADIKIAIKDRKRGNMEAERRADQRRKTKKLRERRSV